MNKPKTTVTLQELQEYRPSMPKPWESFEAEVATYIHRLLDSGDIGLDKRCTRVTPKKPLFSKDRDSNIIFDVAIELFAANNRESPILVWLWECKDYPDRNVKVDEIEELYSKKAQVGAHKATVVTRKGFQSSAISFAKSHGIGLMTLNRELQFPICMSLNHDIHVVDAIVGTYCLYGFGFEIGGTDQTSGPTLGTMIDYELAQWRD